METVDHPMIISIAFSLVRSATAPRGECHRANVATVTFEEVVHRSVFPQKSARKYNKQKQRRRQIRIRDAKPRASFAGITTTTTLSTNLRKPYKTFLWLCA